VTMSRPGTALRFAAHMPGFSIGLALCSIITLNALLLPSLIHLDPAETSLMDVLLEPSLGHPFGTDDLGRDVLVRTLFGLRSSWAAALAVIPVAAAIGTVVGMAAAWLGGWIDTILMRIVDVFLSFSRCSNMTASCSTKRKPSCAMWTRPLRALRSSQRMCMRPRA